MKYKFQDTGQLHILGTSGIRVEFEFKPFS